MSDTVDFGFKDLPPREKTKRVAEVFSAVAPYYNRMNDLMSGGLHRWWKCAAATLLEVRPGMRVLDIATGSGDMAMRLSAAKNINITITDINPAMLALAHRQLPQATAVLADGEQLPFADRSYDRVMIAFGLRNVTNRQRLLNEIHRVLKTGGKYGILEFSPAGYFPFMQKFYLTRVLPLLGDLAAGDADSYRYLGESILRFLSPAQLTLMLAEARLPQAQVHTFAGGMVCLHRGQRTN